MTGNGINSKFHLLRLIFFSMMIISFLFAGCGTLKNGRGWGEEAFSWSSFERIPRAAYRALVDWHSLVPAAGALLLRIDDYDEKISNWAMEHRPLFGSEQAARQASDHIYTTLFLETTATALATPSGEDSKDWISAKMKGFAVEASALGLTGGTTLALRGITARTNPTDSNSRCFPSGHAALGFGAITLSHRNLDAIPMENTVRVSIKAANFLLGTTMVWGRIEGGEHFPTDVLFGAALGNFLCSFIHDAFMGLPEGNGVALSIVPNQRGLSAQLSFTF
jgi:hypothetical protein